MQDLATIEQPANQPAPISAKPAKEPAIPRKVRHGCELIASGECKTVTAAAERCGLSREHLSKMMARPHIQAFVARKASENISRGVLRASSRLVELIDAESEHVAAKVSERLLEHGGILKPQAGSSVNVSINNNMSAGYVIDLSPHVPIDQAQPKPVKSALTAEEG